ncbi:zinc ribbon domain-containing protein [Actinobacteria bacterium YIM 96077]|uniref:Putative regulatory protein FmdB zinc ribbon domain-containing protein n=1 Tax=Phytoactinopolyspora halophila TaxID=1981511 RepID=A0A329QS00_9ACTN|nr:zinc ribbon domain-containing protein [Actinobacteria bacterium YIM 96077]RAW14801.1 hypothetical protein DPM12_09920 [Phytoactinopolyspora halophila]
MAPSSTSSLSSHGCPTLDGDPPTPYCFRNGNIPQRWYQKRAARLEDAGPHLPWTEGSAVAIYEYRCPHCGVFEISRAMGAAPPTHRCAHCGSDARRSYSTPHLASMPRPLADAVSRAEKSQDEPDVVTRAPRPADRSPRATDPRLKHLPRW